MLISNKYEPLFKLLSDDKSHIAENKDIRYVLMTGSRGSAKSFALSTWVNSASYKKGWGILFTRYTMNSAGLSIIPEFKEKAEILGNDNDFAFTNSEVINNTSDVRVDYRGLKPQSKTANSALKSVASKNVFILEEAEECADQALFEKVDLSIRTKNHKNLIIIVMNPCHINHWIYKEFFHERRKDTLYIHTTYLDNLSFLDQSFINIANRTKSRDYKKYSYLFLGEWQKDTDGALFRQRDIESNRILSNDFNKSILTEIVVAYDPAVTDTTPNTAQGEEPDEDGIVVMGKDINQHVYVLADESMRGTRSEIARRLVTLYNKFEASAIVIEKNNGGDFIPALIKTVDRTVRTVTVTATKGKAKRAEPIQAVHENGEIHNVGYFSELEFEMTTWIPDSGMASPNRLDAYVWGATKLIKKVKRENQSFTA
jgi:PBSX family phage terminase large subunit